jgi:VanZ family protein
MPGSSIPKVGWKFYFQLDKVAHFGIYFILAVWLAISLGAVNKELAFLRWILVVVICAIYGIALEAVQYLFLSDRFFEIPDIIANIIGSIAGTVFVYLFLKK